MVATLRAHGLPSRLDGLLADLDHSLVLEAEAFTQTAAEHGFAPEVEPWPVCLGYTLPSCAASRRRLGGACRPVRGRACLPGHLDRRGQRSPADSAYHAWIQNWSGQAFRAFVSALGRGLDELAGTPSPVPGPPPGRALHRAARFELAFWEMCWSGQAWPG